MIYLGNGIYSDAGSSLSHGGPWKDHKYVKIVNGRYFYPEDIKKAKGRIGSGDWGTDTPDLRPKNPLRDSDGLGDQPKKSNKKKNPSKKPWGLPSEPNTRPKTHMDRVREADDRHNPNKSNKPDMDAIFSKRMSLNDPPTKKIPKPDGVGNRRDGSNKKKVIRGTDDVQDPKLKDAMKKIEEKDKERFKEKTTAGFKVNKNDVKNAKSGQNHHSEGLKGWIKDNIIGRPGDTWVHSADGKYMINTKTGEKKKQKVKVYGSVTGVE